MALDDADATSSPRAEAAATSERDPARLVGDERLPCGRLVSQVWEQARAAPGHPDAHVAGCSHCRQAVEGLAVLDRTTRTLRAERPSARTVADRVIRAVRAEMRLGAMVPLDDPARELRIAEIPAAKILRRAADRVPGIRAASCRLIREDDSGTAVAIALTLAASLDEPLTGRAAEVRRAVLDAARQQLGIAVSRIDLTIVSVLEPVRLGIGGDPVPSEEDGR